MEEEGKKNEDILIFDFMDSYQNFTIKTLTSLNWAIKKCNADVFIKSDDDVVFNVSKVLDIYQYHTGHNFESFTENRKFIVGSCKSNLNPERDPSRPYYLSKELYASLIYPRFCFGTTYIISKSAIDSILNQTKHTQLVPAEDISLGILAKASGDIKMIDIVNWRIWFSNLLSRKDYKKYFTVHFLSAEEISFVWNTFYSSICQGLKMWSFLRKSISKECMNMWDTKEMITSEECMKMLELRNTFISDECNKAIKEKFYNPNVTYQGN